MAGYSPGLAGGYPALLINLWEVLAISQFTLYGDCRKGRRPSFSEAAPASEAQQLYEKFVGILKDYGLSVATGRFQAMMLVEIHNDGPVTMLLDSKRKF